MDKLTQKIVADLQNLRPCLCDKDGRPCFAAYNKVDVGEGWYCERQYEADVEVAQRLFQPDE